MRAPWSNCASASPRPWPSSNRCRPRRSRAPRPAIEIPRRNGDPLRFNGEDYLRFFALPNFFFHVTTAYALLRHWGVDLGKTDYLRGG
jgi:hypothetical protein